MPSESIRVSKSDFRNSRVTHTEDAEFRTDHTKLQSQQSVAPFCRRVSFLFRNSGELFHPLLPEGPCVISCPKTETLLGRGRSELYGWNHTRGLLVVNWGAEWGSQLKAFKRCFRMIRAPSRGRATLQWTSSLSLPSFSHFVSVVMMQISPSTQQRLMAPFN